MYDHFALMITPPSLLLLSVMLYETNDNLFIKIIIKHFGRIFGGLPINMKIC